MTLSCLVVDDEPLAVQLLAGHIAQTPFLTLAHSCYDALAAIDWLAHHAADVVFLDINLPHLSGMDMKTLLPRQQQVVFTTAYSSYAVQSYEQDAVDFLLKPITFERFLKTTLKLRSRLTTEPLTADQPANELLFVKSGRDFISVAFDEVLYVEGLKDYVTLVTATERIVVHKRLKDLETSLPPTFSRVHLSYIVNRSKIQRIADNQLWIGSARIPLSDKYRAEFMQHIEARLW